MNVCGNFELTYLYTRGCVIFGHMSLPLRITFEDSDYTFTVLTKSINKQTKAIRIKLGDQEYELSANARGEWDAADVTIQDHPGLLRAIARNVASRYRL